MKKKFMCMLMAAAMTLSMAACGSKGDDANTDANTDGTDSAEVQTFKLGSSGPLTGDSAVPLRATLRLRSAPSDR